MSQQDSITNINGVDAGALGAMIEDITQKPSLGQARFRARNTWISGGHSRTSIQGFYAAGREDTSREQPFLIDSDEPPVLLGENRGANAIEIALTALAACMTGRVRVVRAFFDLLHEAAPGL